MRPVDHFFSRLDAAQKRGGAFLQTEFTALLAPLIGKNAATDLFSQIQTEPGADTTDRIGAAAAFFLGEFDDNTMELTRKDWEAVKDTLEDASGDMDIKTLTALMGDLLERGKI